MKTLMHGKSMAVVLGALMFALSGATSLAGSYGKQAQKDIVDTAIAAGNFSTLVTALQKADLVNTLRGSGPFTVFAPTDAAFAKIPADELNALLQDKAALQRVLTYHVLPQKVMSQQILKGNVKSAQTVQGQPVRIGTSAGVTVNDAKVIEADIGASNGVIHVIDTVILPN